MLFAVYQQLYQPLILYSWRVRFLRKLKLVQNGADLVSLVLLHCRIEQMFDHIFV